MAFEKKRTLPKNGGKEKAKGNGVTRKERRVGVSMKRKGA